MRKELRALYEDLSLWNNILELYNVDKSKVEKQIKDIKQKIREYDRPKEDSFNYRIVKTYGIDGYIELVELPAYVDNMEYAKEFTAEYIRIPSFSCAYDCTGRCFTNWTKVFERNGKFYCYHSVGFDV